MNNSIFQGGYSNNYSYITSVNFVLVIVSIAILLLIYFIYVNKLSL